MLNLRHQHVNVNRHALIDALRTGLDLHRVQYAQAKVEYEAAVVVFLGEALARAQAGVFKDLILRLSPPQNHAADYLDVIEMLEVSVDETVQLDRDAYKAYYRNEWSWSTGFLESASAYKTTLGGGLAAALGGAAKVPT